MNYQIKRVSYYESTTQVGHLTRVKFASVISVYKYTIATEKACLELKGKRN
jgi:hypothetical protein